MKRELAARVAAVSGERTVFGLMNGEYQHARGTDFLYCDHSYFQRGWQRKHFRLVRGGVHLTRVIPHAENRLKRFNVQIAPWRKSGGRVIVVEPSKWMEEALGCHGIAQRMADEVRQYTDREVFLKAPDKSGLEALLQTAWAVVCPVSVAGVEAAIYGVPVFSTPLCPSWPISAGELKDIEKPEYKDRYDWANSLAWSSWHWDELPSINFAEYQR